GKTLLHGDVLMWLMKTLLTSGCTNQRGAGHTSFITPKQKDVVPAMMGSVVVVHHAFSIRDSRVQPVKWRSTYGAVNNTS
ncbi:hypothetical protein, partial [Enterobacter cloacae]|uniref:hypothetical protein n=1 Tax=Enterobacter cloacae TaxID=550 RepID=UPI0020033447